MATLGIYPSSIRYATRFTAFATDINRATPWQREVYAEDLKAYVAAREAFRLKVESSRERVEPEFHNARPSSKDFETRGVAWRRNEIWYTICLAECGLSKDPRNLFGYPRLEFDNHVRDDERSSSEESAVDGSKAAKASGSSTTTSKQQTKGPQRKTVSRRYAL